MDRVAVRGMRTRLKAYLNTTPNRVCTATPSSLFSMRSLRWVPDSCYHASLLIVSGAVALYAKTSEYEEPIDMI